MSDGTLSINQEDNYILGKWKIEVYRYDKNKLAMQFQNNQTVNNILPKFQKLNIKLDLYLEGEQESIYLFDEKEIHKIHSIVKFQIKGKNVQAKSVKTIRKLQKQLNK